MHEIKHFVTEEHIHSIVKELLFALTNKESNDISKDEILFDLKALTKRVDYLDIVTRNVLTTPSLPEAIYIKVGEQHSNDSSFDINIDFAVTGGAFVHLGLFIPPNYSSEMSFEPIVVSMSKETRNFISTATVAFMELIRASSAGVKEFYLKITLAPNTAQLTSSFTVDVHNHRGLTNITTDVLNGEPANTVTINEIKTKTVKAETLVGFDDIPERDILLRSNTINYIETLTEAEYQGKETDGTLDPRTLYNVEEKYQVSE